MQSTICCQGKLLSINKPLVMGILNVTEDSFYDGGLYLSDKALLRQAEKMLSEGADILDVGCVSTHPGAKEQPETYEVYTAEKSVKLLRKHFPEVVISIDTWRASVVKACADSGVSMVNDISGGDFDTEMFPSIAKLQLPYILMHNNGKPEIMQQRTHYPKVVQSVFLYINERLQQLRRLNVKDVIIDVGFGFGKNTAQNYELLRNLQVFKTLDCPILCALSRKSMLYKTIGKTAAESLEATTAAHILALQQGANLLRVHDIQAAKDAIAIYQATFEQTS